MLMDAKDTATLPRGLDEDEVRERLRRHGPNRLPSMPRRRLGRVVLDVLREPMFLLLVAASGLYLALGDRNTVPWLASSSSPGLPPRWAPVKAPGA